MPSSPYFQKFATNGFKPEPTADFDDEFDRLAEHMGWLSLGKAYNRHHDKAQALERQQDETRLLAARPQASSYFSQFAAYGFGSNPDTSFKNEFARLATLMGWSKDSLEYGRNRLSAIQAEFDAHYGSSDKLKGWQDLCHDVGIVAIPGSIKQCKKVRVY